MLSAGYSYLQHQKILYLKAALAIKEKKMTEEVETKCWACPMMMITITHESKEYYICNSCNPQHVIEECIDGCLYVCSKCRSPIAINSDDDYKCEMCGKVVCIACVVYSDDDDECDSFCSNDCIVKSSIFDQEYIASEN